MEKAKESHDETLKKCAEEIEGKHQEKEAKEKAANETKMKEIKELQQQANSKLLKSIKSEVNKEEPMRRLEMLSKPLQRGEINTEPDMDVGEQQPDHASKSKTFLPAKPKWKMKSPSDKRLNLAKISTVTSDRKPDEFCGKPSSSEMSNKDFKKLA
eukprot:CAMPEP_0201982924 /NCGR_PEP_ID=MMETSP0904-20121228/78511_1 /ASSEMBLY_ACC=CAM_ASM_000553 /TAXON_ID=420261 /ORGANISM="Thalassiosira antarctica, Strain CCMP982" /LENGTH=155 /DNA_ID=CAMNT_0048535891 /DNA_START=223 /DNA_END=689 /DNA_ORIENTATION=-